MLKAVLTSRAHAVADLPVATSVVGEKSMVEQVPHEKSHIRQCPSPP